MLAVFRHTVSADCQCASLEIHVAPADIHGFTETAARGGKKFYNVARALRSIIAAKFGKQQMKLLACRHGDSRLRYLAAFQMRSGIDEQCAAFSGKCKREAQRLG